MPKKAVCAEIGVWRGAFSDLILEDTKPERLHLIDPWQRIDDPKYRGAIYGPGSNQETWDNNHKFVLKKFGSEIASGQVVINKGRSTDVSANFPHKYFDWVYIDGDHSYDGVMGDLKTYFHKVKVGGIIAGDDFAGTDWWKDDILRAVTEFIKTHPVRPMLIYKEQYLLRRID